MAERITDADVAHAEAYLAKLMGTEKYKGAYTYIQGHNGHYAVMDGNGNEIKDGLTRREALYIIKALAAAIEYERSPKDTHHNNRFRL